MSTSDTPNPAYAEALLGKGPDLAQTLNMTFDEITRERVVVSMPITPAVHQPFGYLHGGASLALAETAASIGAMVNCPPGMIAFGQELNGNHLRAKRDGLLRATATPIHRGRTSQVWDIRITDEADKLVCVARCTLAIVPAGG